MPIKDPVEQWEIALMLGDNIAALCGKSDPSLLGTRCTTESLCMASFPAITPETVRKLLEL